MLDQPEACGTLGQDAHHFASSSLAELPGLARHALRLHIAPTIDDGDLPPEKAIVGPKPVGGGRADRQPLAAYKASDLINRRGSAFEGLTRPTN
jgi:hypothetical protein